ncbi:MAG TPA: thiamine pyrophosphate-binding protein, partial [Candidatus Nanopelagicaceae bacterium]
MSISTNLARHTVRQLIELGVADVVLSPGSRNAPLSIALHQAQERGLIRLHVRIDERGAAFFALGIAKASGRYVPVVCTSGTAVANFFPAVLEAHHSDINLLLLTADRPAKLRKTGSNQTTNQKDIFKDFVRKSIDSAAPIDLTEILSKTGPVHINLQFDEPLLPTDSKDWLTGINPINLTPIPLPDSELNCETSRNV